MDKKKDLQFLSNQLREIDKKINDMTDLLEREKRLRTKEEDQTYMDLLREKQIVGMRMSALSLDINRENPNCAAESEKMIREAVKAKRTIELQFVREAVVVSDVEKGGLVPVKIMDIVKPLTEGLILDKVGLPFLTGLSGSYVWPTYEAVEAKIEDEGVALTETKINLNKLKAVPQRCGIVIAETREAITQSDGVIDQIVKNIMPKSFALLLNRIMLGVDKAAKATTLVGPFVGKKAGAKTIKDMNFKTLCLTKAELLKEGLDSMNLCWVMTETNKAIAEATPKDKGSGVMVCENDKIAGVPVFCSHYITEDYIGIGNWRYQPAGIFGPISFIIDPYTKADENKVRFVMNADYATTTLLDKAFVLKKVEYTPEV